MRFILVKKKYFLSVCILLLNNVSYANIEDVPLATPEALQLWCKNKTIKYFKEKDKTIQNWSALWKQEENMLDVKASMQSENTDYVVKCRVQQGDSSTKAIISISEKSPAKNHKALQHDEERVTKWKDNALP